MSKKIVKLLVVGISAIILVGCTDTQVAKEKEVVETVDEVAVEEVETVADYVTPNEDIKQLQPLSIKEEEAVIEEEPVTTSASWEDKYPELVGCELEPCENTAIQNNDDGTVLCADIYHNAVDGVISCKLYGYAFHDGELVGDYMRYDYFIYDETDGVYKSETGRTSIEIKTDQGHISIKELNPDDPNYAFNIEYDDEFYFGEEDYEEDYEDEEYEVFETYINNPEQAKEFFRDNSNVGKYVVISNAYITHLTSTRTTVAFNGAAVFNVMLKGIDANLFYNDQLEVYGKYVGFDDVYMDPVIEVEYYNILN